jgi:tRNA threonylcarbamoyladenosine biosynthesis protein TsaE
MIEVKIRNKAEMQILAQKIANFTTQGDIIGLKGSLGVGKSFFAKHFINFLAIKEKNILSPTFNLVYSYDTRMGEIFHFDLYRLKSSLELENIGFFEALRTGICLIEWPEIAAAYLKQKYLEIEIRASDSESEEREIILTLNTDWQKRLIDIL